MNRRLPVALLLVGAALPAVAAAETPPPAPAHTEQREGIELAVALQPREITVGDRVTALLTLTVPTDRLAAEPRFPSFPDGWGSAEVLEAVPPRESARRNDHVSFEQQLVLTAFRPGEVKLPPVEVAVPLAGRTVLLNTPESLSVQVVSVLPAQGADEAPRQEADEGLAPRPPEPLRALPLGAPFWWTTGGLGAACLALVWLLLWQRRRESEREQVAIPAPLEELDATLRRLAESSSVVLGHVELSRALRRFLKRTLHIPALESSTREIERQLLARRLPTGVAQEAVAVLRAADLVKFARHEDDTAALAARVQAARQVGRRIDKHLRPVVPEAETPDLRRAG